MTRPSLHTLLLAVLVLSACHRSDVGGPSQPRVEQSGAITPNSGAVRGDGPQAPAVVRFVLLEQSSSRVRLRAEVSKQAPLTVPLAVEVRSPVGVQLEEGPASWVVPADAQPGTYNQELVFRVEAVPNDVIRLVAHAEGAGFGVHATDAFRVSGTDKSLSRQSDQDGPMPRPTGPAIKVGDTDFGNSVPKQ